MVTTGVCPKCWGSGQAPSPGCGYSHCSDPHCKCRKPAPKCSYCGGTGKVPAERMSALEKAMRETHPYLFKEIP